MSSYSEIFMKEPTSCFSRQSSWYSTEHRDLQATAMSLDWSGQFVLLAGRRHLALQSLDKFDDDEDSLRKFYRNSKHEVSSAEWAICEHSQEYCALATSQLIEVITWRSGHPTLIHSLRAHTRVITDIDWHMKHPQLLASCSIDTFTHLWDLRDPRKPILSLSAVCMSGATQVGFNRVSGNLLATAHDGDLRIWDQRMGSCPIQYITAHLSRIHGINWSHYYETHLTTASQDGTVKYFDINNPRRAERIIKTSSPVWRARYTPFADGLVTVIVPHLGRGENSLLLWNNSKQSAPICSFVGHTDVVLDFAWRPKRNQPSSDMELITWSRDQSVRVWRIDKALQKQCESPQLDDDAFDSSHRLNVPSKPSRNRTQSSCSLQHEFSLLNKNIPHIDVEVLDPIKRTATLRITVNGLVIMLQVTFPICYPDSEIPDFSYCQGTSIDVSDSLMKVLKTSATQRTKNGRPCLEFCLRALVTAFKKATNAGDKTNIRLQSPRLEGALSGCVMDACVPFPRTSGARFNHVGILVTFSQVINSKGISLKHQSTTPRALSALSGGYLGNVMGSQPVLYAHHRDPNSTAFYLHDRVRKSTKNRVVLPKPATPSVLVYDVSKILFVSRDLAENYIIDSKNIAYMCHYNKEIAQQFGYPEIAQCWELAEIVAASTNETESESDDMVFNQVPFPKNILESIILHHAQNYDIQTAAMLCCAFGRHCVSTECPELLVSAISPIRAAIPVLLFQAINSFSRIGNELYLEATQNGLILRTVNDSQTAFAVMNFKTGFFTDFKIDRSDSDEYSNKCKVSMKSCLGVFKNTRQVERCQITLNLKTSKLLFQFNCLFDTFKTHNVSILEQESLNAVYMTDNPPNRMTAPNKMFTDIISNFRMYENEITIEAATDLVVLKNNIDMQTDKHLMRTKLTLKSQEFTDYHISDPTNITFCLKELRAILNFADALSLDMTINFETAGKPVVFAFGSPDAFTANFVMSTLPPPDDASQADRTITRPIPKQKPANRKNDKSLRNQSESRNLTLSLSEVIDLDAHGDVRIPTTMNGDEEMDVIPQSPQPARRRRFKIFPRLYSQTQYPSENRVLQENSDCEV